MKYYGKDNVFSSFYTKVISKYRTTSKSGRNMLLFGIEGVLIALINNFINNNNNLFATRLGASSFELSLVTALPQLVAIMVLIPGAILTDRMINKRRMVILSLIALGVFYFAIGFVPMMGKFGLIAFLILISLSIGPMTMYNASWQAYFSDVVSIGKRNKTFTLRTKWTFIVNIVIPLLTGILLASVSTNAEKLIFHQSFFWIACIFIVLQIFVLKKISGGNTSAESTVTLKDVKEAAIGLVHNKGFLGFLGVAIVFYMGWQLDWTLYFIGQVTYLKLDEAWISYVNVAGALVQFATIGAWSRANEKYGVRFSIIMGGLGLSLFPLIMIYSTGLPASSAPYVFITLSTAANFAFATVSLNIFQCLLQVIPEKNKTLSIAIYTMLTCLSNAIMPMVGVKLYTGFGTNLRALQITFFIIFVVRIIATLLWTLRWWMLRNEPK